MREYDGLRGRRHCRLRCRGSTVFTTHAIADGGDAVHLQRTASVAQDTCLARKDGENHSPRLPAAGLQAAEKGRNPVLCGPVAG